MSKKTLYLIGFSLAVLLALSFLIHTISKKSSGADTTEVIAAIKELPESINKNSLSVISLPDLQQYHYQSIDQEKRIVLEVRMQAPLSDGISNKDTLVLHEPMEGESVYEWEQNNMKFRIFGTYSIKELKNSAKSIRVNDYE